jgi:glycosyltransferase involved in cell wall biosynthesis
MVLHNVVATMVRVLHLLDLQADLQTQRGVEQLARSAIANCTMQQRTLGPGGDWRNAALALPGLRRQLRSGIDICHAWGGAALAAAILSGAARIIYSPIAFPTAQSLRWLRAAMAYRDIHVICPTATLRRSYVEGGVELARCHLIRPGVDFSRVRGRRDPQLRQSLGIDPADHVVLLPGQSTPEAEHRLGLLVISLLHYMDEHWRILLWGRGTQTLSLRRLVARLDQPRIMICPQQTLGPAVEFETLLPAADLALVTMRRSASTLEIAMCMAAALPIVAIAYPTSSELLEDRHTALLTPPGTLRMLARRMLDAQESESLRWAIADMARTEAYEYFSQRRFVEQYASAYAQVAAGKPVDLPPPPPGAGLRFHGRA